MRISDWSSDVCSSDLHNLIGGTTSYLVPAVFDRIDPILEVLRPFVRGGPTPFVALCTMHMLLVAPRVRHLDFLLHAAEEWLERLGSEERRVGKESASTCIARGWARNQKKKKKK